METISGSQVIERNGQTNRTVEIWKATEAIKSVAMITEYRECIKLLLLMETPEVSRRLRERGLLCNA